MWMPEAHQMLHEAETRNRSVRPPQPQCSEIRGISRPHVVHLFMHTGVPVTSGITNIVARPQIYP